MINSVLVNVQVVGILMRKEFADNAIKNFVKSAIIPQLNAQNANRVKFCLKRSATKTVNQDFLLTNKMYVSLAI